ncbi:GntR family transcriptional regulator [Burkholderia guangdongensis]|uniref:GntR family transcriptional regulator n=1 Tax=Burkholderia guangdongensis TaxID=1792500 RepID=UPI0015C7907F|nr:GntR family transcriptional regulator [Burkholderia guangdongensis]
MSKSEVQSRDTSGTAPDAEAHGAGSVSEESRVQQRLADAIYEHRIPPGTKLPEVDLCRILGTSRGTLRKALARLADHHLVQQIPNRGAFVARPGVETTRDVYALRRILEGGMVRSLACRDCRSWIGDVRQQVGEEREANRIGDTSRYIRLAGKFHLDLAVATGNSALSHHLELVIAQTSLMTALYSAPGANTCSVHEHLEILDAIEAGRLQDAERLMEEHLLGCERQLRLGDEPPPAVDLSQALGEPAPAVQAPTKRKPRTTHR